MPICLYGFAVFGCNFPVTAARVWNSLPEYITLSPSVPCENICSTFTIPRSARVVTLRYFVC